MLAPQQLLEPAKRLDLGSGPEPAPGYVGVDLIEQAEPRVVYADLFSGKPWPFEDGSIEALRASHVIEHIPHSRVPWQWMQVKHTHRRQGPGWRSLDEPEAGSRKREAGSPEEPSGAPAASASERVPPAPSEARPAPQVTWSRVMRTQDAFFWFFDEAFRVARPGCRFELAWPHPQSDEADQDPTHCRRIPVATLHYLCREGRRTLRVHQYPVSCDWIVEPGSVMEIAHDEKLSPFTRPDGSVDFAAAKRAHGVFHEIRAVLVVLVKV